MAQSEPKLRDILRISGCLSGTFATARGLGVNPAKLNPEQVVLLCHEMVGDNPEGFEAQERAIKNLLERIQKAKVEQNLRKYEDKDNI